MRKRMSGFAHFLVLLFVASVFCVPARAQKVPPQLQAPAGQQLILRVQGTGDQVYVCKTDAAQPPAWSLKAPDAQLSKEGKVIGKHFAGPSWELNDGSRVTGKAIANVASPDPNSIPWLLVNVVSHEGNGDGVLAWVASIQRLNTKGGKAPASGCDVPHAGQEIRVPYSADYLFYGSKLE